MLGGKSDARVRRPSATRYAALGSRDGPSHGLGVAALLRRLYVTFRARGCERDLSLVIPNGRQQVARQPAVGSALPRRRSVDRLAVSQMRLGFIDVGPRHIIV